MLTRPGGRNKPILFTCDGDRCNEFIETDLSSLELAQVVLRDESWVTKRIDGEWKHFCEDCS